MSEEDEATLNQCLEHILNLLHKLSCSCPAQIATILAERLRAWFAQIEAQFTTQGITVSCTKFDYIVASLSPEFTTDVCNLLLCPLRKTLTTS